MGYSTWHSPGVHVLCPTRWPVRVMAHGIVQVCMCCVPLGGQCGLWHMVPSPGVHVLCPTRWPVQADPMQSIIHN